MCLKTLLATSAGAYFTKCGLRGALPPVLFLAMMLTAACPDSEEGFKRHSAVYSLQTGQRAKPF
jgi:hypothetical protein